MTRTAARSLPFSSLLFFKLLKPIYLSIAFIVRCKAFPSRTLLTVPETAWRSTTSEAVSMVVPLPRRDRLAELAAVPGNNPSLPSLLAARTTELSSYSFPPIAVVAAVPLG